MSSDIFYRDIHVLRGEERVMVTSALFRALHGHQKEQGIPFVLVPFSSVDGRECRIIEAGRIPDGIRVFSDSEHALIGIKLNPMVDDIVQMKRIKCVDVTSAQKHIRIHRMHAPCHAEVSRYERRKDRHASHDIERYAQRNLEKRNERPRPGIHFWMQRDGVKYPFFLDVAILDSQRAFQCANTYGCGTAPFVDF